MSRKSTIVLREEGSKKKTKKYTNISPEIRHFRIIATSVLKNLI